MTANFNELSPAEAERLALLAEECGEVVQIIGKVLRHGYDSRHPSAMDGPDNRAMLIKELGDLRAAILLMVGEGDIDEIQMIVAAHEKRAKLWEWTHHQRLSP
jgi:NTP pyrophosphatase (non-canonical NTP hydrolase)